MINVLFIAVQVHINAFFKLKRDPWTKSSWLLFWQMYKLFSTLKVGFWQIWIIKRYKMQVTFLFFLLYISCLFSAMRMFLLHVCLCMHSMTLTYYTSIENRLSLHCNIWPFPKFWLMVQEKRMFFVRCDTYLRQGVIFIYSDQTKMQKIWSHFALGKWTNLLLGTELQSEFNFREDRFSCSKTNLMYILMDYEQLQSEYISAPK